MNLQIAEEITSFLSKPISAEASEMIVLELYRQHRISGGKAAELLGLARGEFQDRAARAGIPYLDLGPSDLELEFEAADRIVRAHGL